MELRRAAVADARGIATVHVLTWQYAYRGLVPDDYLDGLTIEGREKGWRETLPDLTEGMSTWVALDQDRVIGFAGWGPSRDLDADDATGEVFAIYVDPDRWSTGAGGALMERALEDLRGRFERATLWVLEGNDRARRFYEAVGWSADGARKEDDRWGAFVLHEVRYAIDLSGS